MADEQKETLKQVLANNAVWHLMNATAAAKVATKSNVAVVHSHNSAHHAIHVLAKKKVVACPVLNASDKQEPIGFIQTTDILSYVIQSLGDVEKITAQQLEDYSFTSTTLKDVLDKAQAEPVTLSYDTTPLSHFVEVFAAGVHRTALYTQVEDSASSTEIAQEKMTAIISQSDVIRFLAAHLQDDNIKFMADQTITRVGFKAHDVQSIDASANVLKAILKLKSARVSCLVINDDKGVAIGAITPRAFRGLTADTYKDLLLPVGDFLKKHAPDMLKLDKIDADVKFGDLITNFASKHLHHQYILNADGSVQGVVSLTDIMRWIIAFDMTPAERLSASRVEEEKTAVATPVTLTLRINQLAGLARKLTSNYDVYLLLKFPGGRSLKTRVLSAKPDDAGLINANFTSLDPEQFIVQKDHIDSRIIIEAYDQGRFLGDTFLGRCNVGMRYVLDGFGTGKDIKQSMEDRKLSGGSSSSELKFELYLSPVKLA